MQAQRAAGLKTEPALAAALDLPGPDPYAALLAVASFSEATLRALAERAGLPGAHR